MPNRTKLHVVHNSKSGNWQVKREGSSRATSNHQTKEQAVSAGRNLARSKEPSQLLIHNMNGRISNEHIYGNDPYPPKG